MAKRTYLFLLAFFLFTTSLTFAAKHPAAAPAANPAFDRVIDRVIAREKENTAALRNYTPLIETYFQTLQLDQGLNLMVPVHDDYFLHRVALRNTLASTDFRPRAGFFLRLANSFEKPFRQNNREEIVADGFAWMMLIDLRGLDRQHYNFEYQGREFLGDLRCLVIDVTPKSHAGPYRFFGRIWVEDRDDNIVRFNGTFVSSNVDKDDKEDLHFDTWRLNVKPNVWLPAYIYSEDKIPAHRNASLGNYKSLSRIWGYNVGQGRGENEFTDVVVDDANAVKDNSDVAQDQAPVAATRSWQRQAEDNVVERLERGGLLARDGEVDKVLDTVVNNLEITNNLDIQPDVRCRVLLTTPIESFTMGHTIFISRGMLDVLPDEATLAAVLAHELSHIVLGHPTDTTFAFKDRTLVPDADLLRRMHFVRSAAEEHEADVKALALLRNSPYKDKLENVGLFLRQVEARRTALPNLLRSDMGNSLYSGKAARGELRMKELANTAPKLEPKKVEQLAALPLGGRIKVDPFNDRIEISRAKAVQLLTPGEKMPFEITPVFLHLSRYAAAPDNAAVSSSAASPSVPAQPATTAEPEPQAR